MPLLRFQITNVETFGSSVKINWIYQGNNQTITDYKIIKDGTEMNENFTFDLNDNSCLIFSLNYGSTYKIKIINLFVEEFSNEITITISEDNTGSTDPNT
jgi:hypothetical protein